MPAFPADLTSLHFQRCSLSRARSIRLPPIETLNLLVFSRTSKTTARTYVVWYCTLDVFFLRASCQIKVRVYPPLQDALEGREREGIFLLEQDSCI